MFVSGKEDAKKSSDHLSLNIEVYSASVQRNLPKIDQFNLDLGIFLSF